MATSSPDDLFGDAASVASAIGKRQINDILTSASSYSVTKLLLIESPIIGHLCQLSGVHVNYRVFTSIIGCLSCSQVHPRQRLSTSPRPALGLYMH